MKPAGICKWIRSEDGFVCSIIDANVVSDVFGSQRSEAGKQFFAWIERGRERLVVGGHLRKELQENTRYRKWELQARRAGVLFVLKKTSVEKTTSKITKNAIHKSNDPHVIAVAQLSGARLLFTNDQKLQDDFRNPALINRPRGKIFTTLASARSGPDFKLGAYTRTHRKLLNKSNLCVSG